MAKIMLVDDDLDLAEAVAKVLGVDGHKVVVEESPDKALAAMRKDPPDLAILDVMFPENSSEGFTLAQTMHGDSALRGVPILMLTAINVKFPLGFSSSDIDDVWMPVTAFLEKPVDLDVLREKVSAILKKSAGQG